TNTLTGQKSSTSTDLDGSFVLQLSANGRYVVRAQMPAFANATQEVVLNATNRNAQANLELILLSRAQQEQRQQQQQEMAQQRIASANGNGRGFQSLSVMQGQDSEGWGTGAGADQNMASSFTGMENTATESVSISGNTSNPFANMSS